MSVFSSLAGKAFKAVANSFIGKEIKEWVLLSAAEINAKKALEALGRAKKGYEYDAFAECFVSKYKVGTPQCRNFIKKMQTEYEEAVKNYETLSAGEIIPTSVADVYGRDIAA